MELDKKFYSGVFKVISHKLERLMQGILLFIIFSTISLYYLNFDKVLFLYIIVLYGMIMLSYIYDIKKLAYFHEFYLENGRDMYQE